MINTLAPFVWLHSLGFSGLLQAVLVDVQVWTCSIHPNPSCHATLATFPFACGVGKELQPLAD